MYMVFVLLYFCSFGCWSFGCFLLMYKMYTITVFIVESLITLKDHLKITNDISSEDQKISAQKIKITNDLVILLKLIVTFTYFRIGNYSHSCFFFRKINFEL